MVLARHLIERLAGRKDMEAPVAALLFRNFRDALLEKLFAARRQILGIFLDGSDTNFGNSLLLPNRDLDFAYAKLDLYGTYTINRHITVFTELGNLLSQQHIGPIGYPSLPFTVRAGLKARIGGD